MLQYSKTDPSNQNLYEYSRYALILLLDLVLADQNWSRFCHPAVIHLQEYDREHKSEYVKTLYMYLMCG